MACSVEQRTASCAYSVASQASVCHTKPFPFVEVTYWRELTIGMTEMRGGEMGGKNLNLSRGISSTEFTGNVCLNRQFFLNGKFRY